MSRVLLFIPPLSRPPSLSLPVSPFPPFLPLPSVCHFPAYPARYCGRRCCCAPAFFFVLRCSSRKASQGSTTSWHAVVRSRITHPRVEHQKYPLTKFASKMASRPNLTFPAYPVPPLRASSPSTPHPRRSLVAPRSVLYLRRWIGFDGTPGSGSGSAPRSGSKKRRRNEGQDEDEGGGGGWGDVLLMSQRPVTPVPRR